MGAMLSCSFPGLTPRERWIRSAGRILLYKVNSSSVSCVASIMGSISSSSDFSEDLGKTGDGDGEGRVACVVLTGISPRFF